MLVNLGILFTDATRPRHTRPAIRAVHDLHALPGTGCIAYVALQCTAVSLWPQASGLHRRWPPRGFVAAGATARSAVIRRDTWYHYYAVYPR